jgi:isoprenylcysteine carboxyl methyltransferase (ICMT) family protein YpbQ
MQDITEKLIKNYTVYHKIFYVFMVLLTVLSRVMKFTDNTPVCVTFATVVFVFALLDSVFYHMGVFKNMKFLTTFRSVRGRAACRYVYDFVPACIGIHYSWFTL